LFCDKLLSRKRTIKFEARSLIEFLSKWYEKKESIQWLKFIFC
jgi:hypothetical protein